MVDDVLDEAFQFFLQEASTLMKTEGTSRSAELGRGKYSGIDSSDPRPVYADMGRILSSTLFSCTRRILTAESLGTLFGAITGALIGQERESGFIKGSSVGAISGAVFSIEVLESSLVLWQSDGSGLGCHLYVIDVIASLLSGRLVRERIGPAMLSAV